MVTKLFAGTAAAAAVALLLQVPTASAGGQRHDQQAWQQRDGMRDQRAMRTAPAQFKQVTGEILDIRAIPIRGVDARNVLVLLETQQGERVVVDLGDRLRDVDLQAGDRLRARGEVVNIEGRRPILFANTFHHEGRTHEANRVGFFQGYDDSPGYGGGQDQR